MIYRHGVPLQGLKPSVVLFEIMDYPLEMEGIYFGINKPLERNSNMLFQAVWD